MSSYICQRGSTLHFRIKVPDDIKNVLGCTEIKQTLRTGYRSQARIKATLLAGLCLDTFDAIRAGAVLPEGWLMGEMQRLSCDRIKQIPSEIAKPGIVESPQGRVVVEDGLPTVMEAVKRYLEESQPKWRKKTYSTFKLILEEFVEIIQGKRLSIGRLSLDVMRKFKRAAIRLPKNMHKRKPYMGKSLRQILQMEIPESDLMSHATLTRRLVVVKGFLKWLRINYGIQGEFSPLLTLEAPKKVKRSNRECFTDEDIQALFGTPAFKNKTFAQPYKYWVPLIGLHQGMRLNEIYQLYLEDIKQVDGIWCFNINDDAEDKRLKTPSSNLIF